MRVLGSPAAVVAAIHEDADAEVERIERESRAALARLAEEEAAEPKAPPEREVRLAAARREAREIVAQEDLLDAREALTAREAWIARAVAEGRRRLAEPVSPAERRAVLARLAREGVERLPGPALEVVVAPPDAALLDDAWAGALSAGRARVAADPAIPPGGCVVRSPGGEALFDNTLEARARRFEASWRSALGAVYQAAGRDA